MASKILDVGCGDGANARKLTADGKTVDGITLSSREAQIAELACRKIYIHDLEAGLPQLEFEPYDVVICSHVLEHICYPQKLLNDIHSSLREDGVFVVALPNL